MDCVARRGAGPHQQGRQDSGSSSPGFSGGENAAQNAAQTLSEAVVRAHPVAGSGVIVRPGGPATVNAQITSQLQQDLLLMESLAIPLSLLVLIWVFGGLLAAACPSRSG